MFYMYIFPWLCVWECCIIILLAHGHDLASVSAHLLNRQPPSRKKKHNPQGLSDVNMGQGRMFGPISGFAIAIIQMYTGLSGFYFLWYCAVYDVIDGVHIMVLGHALLYAYCSILLSPSYKP